MKTIGYVLITLGFLAGSLVAVLEPENVIDWKWFAPAFLVCGVGVALAQFAARQESQHEDSVAQDMQDVSTSLDSVVEKIDRLEAEKDTVYVYDLPGRIDELFPHDLNTFVEARKSIGHVHGLQAYADVMNDFAAGERYLNRVWSASVDGYVDEAREYLTRSKTQFHHARETLRRLMASGASAG